MQNVEFYDMQQQTSDAELDIPNSPDTISIDEETTSQEESESFIVQCCIISCSLC